MPSRSARTFTAAEPRNIIARTFDEAWRPSTSIEVVDPGVGARPTNPIIGREALRDTLIRVPCNVKLASTWLAVVKNRGTCTSP